MLILQSNYIPLASSIHFQQSKHGNSEFSSNVSSRRRRDFGKYRPKHPNVSQNTIQQAYNHMLLNPVRDRELDNSLQQSLAQKFCTTWLPLPISHSISRCWVVSKTNHWLYPNTMNRYSIKHWIKEQIAQVENLDQELICELMQVSKRSNQSSTWLHCRNEWDVWGQQIFCSTAEISTTKEVLRQWSRVFEKTKTPRIWLELELLEKQRLEWDYSSHCWNRKLHTQDQRIPISD